MGEFKVFYSWQSDLPNATNRTFIADALARACEQVSKNPEIEESPRVDQDTQGVPGSPAIPATIMEKIDECQVFVADVSICFTGPKDKLAPNPNVLYELGYAVARLGWDRVILVMNQEYGAIERLPFDLEKRRVTGSYRAKEGESDRSEEKKALTGKLVAGIEAIVRRQPIVPKRTPADEAIEAVENQAPARKARIRDFWKWTMSELYRLEPDLRTNPPQGEYVTQQIAALNSAIDATGEVARLWSRVCEAIALASDGEGAEAVTRGFGDLLQEYDHKPGYSGVTYDTYFDFWRFIGHELWTIWIGSLLKEERWEFIDAALGRTFFWEQHRARTNHGSVSYEEFSVFVYLLDIEGKANNRLSRHADLLAVRYGPDGIGSTLAWTEFIDADLFLFIAGELRLKPGWGGWLQWRPWSVLYMKHQPRFLEEAVSKRFANGVKLAFGEQDADKVKQLVKERIPKLRELWPSGFWRSPVTNEVIDSFDSKG